MTKAKIIEAEAQARWDAILSRDLKEQTPPPNLPSEQKDNHETTLGRTVPSQHN
jgi:hypothetical protein